MKKSDQIHPCEIILIRRDAQGKIMLDGNNRGLVTSEYLTLAMGPFSRSAPHMHALHEQVTRQEFYLP